MNYNLLGYIYKTKKIRERERERERRKNSVTIPSTFTKELTKLLNSKRQKNAKE